MSRLRYSEVVAIPQLQFIRSVPRLPINTSNCYVRLETGVTHWEIEVWKICLNWWAKMRKIMYSKSQNK